MRGYNVLSIAVLAALLPAVPTVAGGNEKAVVDPKDKIVCKRTQKTGTRFYDKVCKTAAQWELMAEEARRGLSEQVNRPQQNVQPAGPGG